VAIAESEFAWPEFVTLYLRLLKGFEMPSWVILFSAIEVFALPVVGVFALAMSKLADGPTAHIAQRWFLGILLAVTLITCRTVIVLGPCWFAHTATLGFLIVGALLTPDRASMSDRDIATSWR